ncbi:related to CST26 - protein required for incorporation of stearic acid into phosphatidylinositol [Melanopsichium pennsylvanicum]|uniref:Related to CST26 - protein required for incorporation of stearic acid into phosphatidylinositol n=2 Tax=Melanopsichium pennsylvanicum TaxID=63383 RepID=A0AAJ5C8A7_9BASI|nr:acyltransferase-domain-containing protein [Melanopsichium pennsylvanicum 4]SNX87810.1 related to CST26 - protein required for incorporation of stearic acid into phosphatidylinositol [Melanopsichium pennsylvanicum]
MSSEGAAKDEVSAKTELGSISTTPPYLIPISSRPPKQSYVQTLLFGLIFNFCIVSDHLFQLLSWPLSLHPSTAPIYRSNIAYSKLAFARALLVISQFFGPTQLVISIGDGKGGYIDPEAFVHRHKQTGRITSIDLPSRAVWMSNHQVYTDWLYLWCLAYYADMADAVLIILKKSLKWIPFVGWGMQFYRFIFLARNWASDQAQLGKQLGQVASENHAEPGKISTAKKLLLMIFPEGTLVSADTRPISTKFAQKQGIQDLENVLLPRSTGLFFCLRTLAKEMSDLWLVDFAIGYPGIPPAGYGQDYYTLRSVFMQGNPPPAIHIHLRMTSVTDAVAHDTSSNSIAVANVESKNRHMPPLGEIIQPAESSEEERKQFDEWLRQRWTEKDELMHKFYQHGDFVGGDFAKAIKEGSGRVNANEASKGKYVVLPAELRSLKEVGDAMSWGIPFIVAWNVSKLYKAFFGSM